MRSLARLCCILLLASCAPEGGSTAAPGPEGRGNQPWTGLRKAILDFHAGGSAAGPVSVYRGKPRVPILTFEANLGGRQGRLELNEAGKRFVRDAHRKKYAVALTSGPTIYFLPKEVTEASSFKRLQVYHGDGARIQLVPFPDGLGVPARRLHRLHVGSSLASCVLEEVLGATSRRPLGMMGWKESFAGRPLSKLFRVSQTTGKKTRPIGWIVDLATVEVEGEGHFVLKQVLVHDEHGLPPRLVTRPYGDVGGRSYRGYVVGDDGEPRRDGPFVAFGAALLYAGINVPE